MRGEDRIAQAIQGAPVGQIGVVVTDLEQACGRYSALWRNGPWRCFTYSKETLSQQQFRGRPSEYSMRIALNGQTPQIELIQPLVGPSTYHEHLERRGESLHHLGFFVESADEAVESMARAGYGVLQLGRGFGLGGDGAFVYFDTQDELGVILEAIELPKLRREPELIVP